MKTRIIIEVETKDMKDVYNTDNQEEWTEDNKITDDLEKDLHKVIGNVIDARIQDDDFEDSVIEGMEEYWCDSWDSLSDAGNISIKVIQDEL